MFERADLRGWKLSACIVLGSVTGAWKEKVQSLNLVRRIRKWLWQDWREGSSKLQV